MPLRLSRLARPWSEVRLNALTERLRALEQAGRPVLDLVTANPHEHELCFPAERLGDAIRQALAAGAVYRPHPLGQPAAREAVAAWYGRRGVRARAEAIVLTPGTSLAYLYLFRLLCNPGEEVLVPRPGYPLFEDICALAGIRPRYYHLRRHRQRWAPDFEDLAFQATPRTRAVVVVSPHNPLGIVLGPADWEALAAVCRERDLALIADEVFCEFLTTPGAVLPRPAPDAFSLAFTLNGFSKMYSLPGTKLGWIKVDGEAAGPALAALEYVSDLLLPVSEVVQAAAPAILDGGDEVSRALADAYRERRRVLEAALPWPCNAADGGVYVCAEIGGDEDAFCQRALEQAGVLLHPGHFYALPGHAVMTCVAHPEVLRSAAQKVQKVGTPTNSER